MPGGASQSGNAEETQAVGLPGANEASNAPKKNLTAIIPDQLNVAACNVPHTAQPNTQNDPQMCGGITFHINAKGSKIM